MIFRKLINKLKNKTIPQPKQMNMGVKIVELARELNCLYVNERNRIGITSGIVYFSNHPYNHNKSLWYNVMKSCYAVLGYVDDEKQYKLVFKNFYRCPQEEMTTERYFTDYEEFKHEYIKCLDGYYKYMEDYYLTEVEKDFK